MRNVQNSTAKLHCPLLFAFASLFAVAPALAQTGSAFPPACQSAEARQFDFWLGEWNIVQEILQADGTWLKLDAATKVSRALDGCALLESWEGKVLFFWEGMKTAELLRGMSVRAYDAEKKKWSLHWMDTRHPQFAVFEGSFANGIGTFLRATTTAQHQPRLTRIMFSEITASSVRWELAISTDAGANWQPLWVMNMQRKK
ncbi:hypothetical protein EDS67_21025 [candidate division KSB1 bacterium]|nr:MAG: hypothetical protein EDS67_21025 [candidate division KSB1 bacterium]MBC6948250.1 hypothetical protein [candidate division KSB1 bacterium]MCE7943510.1 hypothetical protein [Chlorobi bacterium CHB1]MDL1877824.1 hypothetical protein [Cytophagia bacterium CHB2]